MIVEGIIQAVINTFNLNQHQDLNQLENVKDLKEIARVKGLPNLIDTLYAEKVTPKTIMEELELVMVNIHLEDEQSDFEKKFLKQIEELVYKPMNNVPMNPASPGLNQPFNSFKY